MKGKIKNDADWFLASLCVRCEPLGTDARDRGQKYLTWLNTYLVHARDIGEAFDKAVALGKKENIRYRTRTGRVKWRFVGLWDLVPIYDDLADGEEIAWHDYGRITGRVARQRCITKRQAVERFAMTSQTR